MLVQEHIDIEVVIHHICYNLSGLQQRFFYDPVLTFVAPSKGSLLVLFCSIKASLICLVSFKTSVRIVVSIRLSTCFRDGIPQCRERVESVGAVSKLLAELHVFMPLQVAIRLPNTPPPRSLHLSSSSECHSAYSKGIRLRCGLDMLVICSPRLTFVVAYIAPIYIIVSHRYIL